MAQREFLSGIARNEQASLEFLRSRSVLESKDEARCIKLVNGVACESKMYAGQRNGKPSWRCIRIGCNGVRSVKAGNEFFVFRDVNGRLQSKLPLHRVLELMSSSKLSRVYMGRDLRR